MRRETREKIDERGRKPIALVEKKRREGEGEPDREARGETESERGVKR